MSKQAEIDLENAIQEERDKSPSFDELCEYHDKLMKEVFKDKIPMLLVEENPKEAERLFKIVGEKMRQEKINRILTIRGIDRKSEHGSFIINEYNKMSSDEVDIEYSYYEE